MKPTDYVNSINNKSYIFDPNNNKDYVPFVINKWLSIFPDLIFHVNIINQYPGLSSKAQYDYFYYAIPKKKRFQKWSWPSKQIPEDVQLIAQKYKYSIPKAKAVLALLTPEQLDIIKQQNKQGGIE
jgi:hypothetical protein